MNTETNHSPDAEESPNPSLDQVLEVIRKAAREGYHEFNPPTTIESMRQITKAKGLSLEIPEVWCKILSEANGARIYGVCGDLCIQSDKYLTACHGDHTERGLEHYAEFPLHFLNFATTGDGDFLSLDTSKLTSAGDCPVILMSHETFKPERVWPSILTFVMEVLEGEIE